MRLPTIAFVVLLACCIGNSVLAEDRSSLRWEFQYTGFDTSLNQTAVAMRDNQAWPVVFTQHSYDNITAYSLMPVLNPSTATHWHQIGSQTLSGEGIVLRAATSPDGRVAAFSSPPYSGAVGTAIVGQAQTGWQSLSNVNAVAFGVDGTLYTANNSTVPLVSSGDSLVSLAVSPNGSLGAVDTNMNYYHYDAWLSTWFSEGLSGSYLDPCTIQTVFDTNGVPYVVGVSGSGVVSGSGISAYQFDTISGQWESQEISLSQTNIANVALAADSQGRVGVAWTECELATGDNVLKYAYKDAGPEEGWDINTVATAVNSGSAAIDIPVGQSVGLAFDQNDFPVISFVDAGGGIWLAYDPPVTVPEPSTWLLLVVGAVALLVCRKMRNHA